MPDGLRFDSNDAAGKSYAKVSSIRVPSMTAKALLASPSTPNLWYEAAQVTADAYLDIYFAPPGWREKAAAQTAFIAEQDKETRRVAFLYDPQATKYSGGRFSTFADLPSAHNMQLRTSSLIFLRFVFRDWITMCRRNFAHDESYLGSARLYRLRRQSLKASLTTACILTSK